MNPQLLEKRLMQRGRENAEQIAQRLQRAEEFSQMIVQDPQVMSLDNSNSLEISLQQLQSLVL